MRVEAGSEERSSRGRHRQFAADMARVRMGLCVVLVLVLLLARVHAGEFAFTRFSHK